MTTATHFARVVGEATLAAVPLEVILELTQRCNFRCAHCYLPSHRDTDPLPTPRVLALVEELAAAGTLFLTLSGGEPLLRPNWREIVRHARRLGFAVTVLTNGSLVDEEAAAFLAAERVSVEVSVYATDSAVFDNIVGAAGAAAAVRRALEAIARHGARLTLKVPVLAANAGSVTAVRALARDLGADCLTYPTVFARRDGDPGPMALALAGEALAGHLQASPDAPRTLPAPAPDRDDWPLCAAGTRAATVTASGELLPCPLFPQAAGNLRHSSFREVWGGSALLARLRSLRWRDLATCRGCPRTSYCGRCPAQALLEGGDGTGPSPSACSFAAALEKARGCCG